MLYGDILPPSHFAALRLGRAALKQTDAVLAAMGMGPERMALLEKLGRVPPSPIKAVARMREVMGVLDPHARL